MINLRSLLEDWSLKLFSLGTALVLFLFVSWENATPIDVRFNLEYRVGDDIMVVGDPLNQLRATLKGPGTAFRSFEPADLAPVVVDLSRAGPGTVRHSIDLNTLSAPAGMQVLAVQPAELHLVLDRRVERQVPVHPDIPETPAFGYEILDVRIVPLRARVVGPAAMMQGLDFIATRPIDVSGREEDLSLEVDLRPPPPPMRLVDKRVNVFVEVGEEFVQRTLQNIPVQVEGTSRSVAVQPTTVALTVRGPRRIVEALDRAKLEAVVDLSTVGETTGPLEHVLHVRPELPERTQLVAPVPKIQVTLTPVRRSMKKR